MFLKHTCWPTRQLGPLAAAGERNDFRSNIHGRDEACARIIARANNPIKVLVGDPGFTIGIGRNPVDR